MYLITVEKDQDGITPLMNMSKPQPHVDGLSLKSTRELAERSSATEAIEKDPHGVW